MSVRSFRTSSIRTGEKRSKFWDQSTIILNPAFESIATLAPTTTTSTLEFTSIPQTYVSLQLRFNYRDNQSRGVTPFMQFNNVTTSTYADHSLANNGLTVSANGSASRTEIVIANSTSNSTDFPTIGIIDIHDYASTTKNKTVRILSGMDPNGGANPDIGIRSGLFISTNAITSIQLKLFGGGNFSSGSSVALYGIRGA